MANQKKPLEGVRIIELANYVAVPVISRICADMGAEVIKIEGRGGDAWRRMSADHTQTPFEENPVFDTFNLGKKSVSLNIKTPKGKEIFFRLLEDADILITNTRDRSLIKLGVDYESIRDRFPRLIYAALTGYGDKGPDRDAPGFDNIAFWSRSGFVADMMIKSEGGYPVNTRYAMGDTITGTTLFGALMAALYQRERTGRGEYVTQSLYGAAIWAFGGCLIMAEEPYRHEFPERRRQGIAMNLAYECADGEWVRCTILEFERYAPRFFEVLGVTEQMEALGVTSMGAMMDKAEELVPIYEEIFRQKTSGEWLKALSDMDIVSGRISHFADVLTDEQAWANDYLTKYRCLNGEERIIPACPVRFASQGVFPHGEAFRCGQHNEEVLASLGYTKEDAAAFLEDGTLM